MPRSKAGSNPAHCLVTVWKSSFSKGPFKKGSSNGPLKGVKGPSCNEAQGMDQYEC